MRKTNNSRSTFTLPTTSSSSSHSSSTTSSTSCTSTVTTSPSSQTAPSLDHNALSQAISRAFADSLPALLSSLRGHVGKNTSTAFGSVASSDPTPSLSALSSFNPYPCQPSSSSGTLVVPSFISTYSTLGSPSVVSSLPSAISVTNPPLPVGGSSSGAAAPLSMPPTLAKAFVIGLGYTPVPYKLVAKITGGQFIELADLLSDNIKAQETEPQAFLEGRLLVSNNKKRVVEITDIMTWVEAFSIFCLVLCQSYPSRWRDLTQYKLLIIQTAKRFQGKSWLNYDIAFRKEAAATGSTDWSRMNADLFNFHTRSPSTLSSSGSAPSPAASSTVVTTSSGSPNSSQYCHSWNAGRCRWPFGRCRFRHSCESCNGDHPRLRCPHHPARTARSRSPSPSKGGRRYR